MKSAGLSPQQNQLIDRIGIATRHHAGLLKDGDVYFDKELLENVTVKAVGIGTCRIEDTAGKMHFRDKNYVEVEVRNEKFHQ